MTQLQSGDVATLVVKEVLESKYILTNDEVDVPLNASDVLEELQENQSIEVFLYADRRGDLSATTAIPHVRKGEYGWAKVLQVKDHEGAIVDIGTSREV
ncbi:MAG: S1-like domain-containing RNA-binding protein, partial [Lysinibacillus sp.]